MYEFQKNIYDLQKEIDTLKKALNNKKMQDERQINSINKNFNTVDRNISILNKKMQNESIKNSYNESQINNDYENFYDLAKKIREERLKKEDYESIENISKNEFAKFCFWGRAFGYSPNLESFKKYLKENKLNFWIIKEITEDYFNIQYDFDYKKTKWVIKEKQNEIRKL